MNSYSRKSELQRLNDCLKNNELAMTMTMTMVILRKVSYQVQVNLQIKVD